MTFQFGIDALLNPANETALQRLQELRQRRVGLVAHPASVTTTLEHSLDALIASNVPVDRAFGPQHGMRGDKQDNMIESEDYLDPRHGIPVISLYGEHRRPTPAMLEGLDVVLFDLQDVGCRIYTYITTLKYFLEACAAAGVALWVLDRPNPAGRPVDGLRLETGQESFVGCDILPTRHGLTVGELATWLVAHNTMDVDLQIINMRDYAPSQAPGFGWPILQRPWVNPSPNASSLNMSRCFAGTVLLEGTHLSEGRGTTVPLEIIGAPDFPATEALAWLQKEQPAWLAGVYTRACFFSPTFHKHQGELCAGIQIHTDFSGYDHELFRPYRLIAGLLKALRSLRPDYDLWRHHEYEYEPTRIPIDVINGGTFLRTWVDDSATDCGDLEARLLKEEAAWLTERQAYLRYL
jgi:uncharacterized protein YbbC (DUF1343 family)